MSQDITLETLANRKMDDIGDTVEENQLLTGEIDQEKIDRRAESIDLLDTEKASSFGEEVFRDLLGFGQRVLAHVRGSDFSGIDGELAKLKTLVKDLSVETMNSRGFASKIPFLRSFSSGIRNFEKKFGTVLEQTAAAETRLCSLAEKLRADKFAYDTMLEEERPLLEAFDLDLAAAEQKVQIAYEETLPRLESEALDTEDPEATTLVREFTSKVSGFAAKLGDMQAAHSHLAQVGPQIMSIQANNLQLADKISQVTTKILPYWKSQVALAISMIKEEETLRKKREALKKSQGGIDDYRQSGEGDDLNLVDLDAVMRINTNLLSTISDTAMLQRAGQSMRIDTEATLLRLDGKVRQAMISAAAFGEQEIPAEATAEPVTEEPVDADEIDPDEECFDEEAAADDFSTDTEEADGDQDPEEADDQEGILPWGDTAESSPEEEADTDDTGEAKFLTAEELFPEETAGGDGADAYEEEPENAEGTGETDEAADQEENLPCDETAEECDEALSGDETCSEDDQSENNGCNEQPEEYRQDNDDQGEFRQNE